MVDKHRQKNVREVGAKYFEQLELSSDQLSTLMRANDKPARRQSYVWWAAVAAVLVVLLGPGRYWQDRDALLTQKIAQEVVKNHLKLKPLEVEQGSMHEVSAYFQQLAFRPFSSAALSSELQLQGGRYCSIQGVDAAQLRYQHQQRLLSLYQVSLSAEQLATFSDDPVNPTRVQSGGLDVSMWLEQGILQVLVTPDS